MTTTLTAQPLYLEAREILARTVATILDGTVLPGSIPIAHYDRHRRQRGNPLLENYRGILTVDYWLEGADLAQSVRLRDLDLTETQAAYVRGWAAAHYDCQGAA